MLPANTIGRFFMVILCLTLSACSGGTPTVLRVPLMPGPGQTLSDAAPVFAADENDTLDTTLEAGKVHPVLSATLERDFDNETAQLSQEVSVKTIRTDDYGTYVVTYVLDGREEEVTLDTSNCPSDCEFLIDGRGFVFWSWTDSQTDVHDGREEFDYMASLTLSPNEANNTNPRIWFVFGVRTEELPTGNATYYGRFRADSWAGSDRVERQRYSGTMRLVANFDMRQLEGRIFGVRGSPRGSSTRSSWPTSSFTLTNGRIVNGQFTAVLKGVDSNPDALFDESVRDFLGHILGEFYGPNAEEVGGVVTATRDVAGESDDRVLHGFIGGEKTEPLTGINDTAPLVTGVYRDSEANPSSTSLIDTDLVGPTTVESTSDGFKVTYVVDGETRTIEFGESDFGARFSFLYSKVTDGTEYRLQSSSFLRQRSFEYLDINQWGIYPDPDDVLRQSNFGFMVYGKRTTDMPTTGTGTYAGRMGAREWPSDNAVGTNHSSVKEYRGSLSLTANFGNSSVVGSITDLQNRSGDVEFYGDVDGGLSFNAAINGNGMTATDLSGTGALAGYSNGSVNGAFYGPAGAEVGGVFEAADTTSNKLLTGYFAGKKQ